MIVGNITCFVLNLFQESARSYHNGVQLSDSILLHGERQWYSVLFRQNHLSRLGWDMFLSMVLDWDNPNERLE